MSAAAAPPVCSPENSPGASLLSATVRKLKTENLSRFTFGTPTNPDLLP